MKTYLDVFFGLGVYAYVIIGLFVFGWGFAILSAKMNKKSKDKWLENHPGAVKVTLAAENHILTQKQISAYVVSGEGAVFMETSGYVIYAMPGEVVLEVTYTYTRPGVLHKTVTTTWGPAKVELALESGKEYRLTFDKKEEQFHLSEI